MSGHSKWSTIKRQKEATDAKRGAVFTKLGNQIAIAARAGSDPDMNPALAMAVEKAKSANMPIANIQRAIDRVKDKNSAVLEEVTYEGYGPGGMGVIIECATDNRNRTFPEVRNALTKNGGRVADAGSVVFLFDHKGVIRVEGGGDDLMMQALEAGAQDIAEEDKESLIYTNQKDLAKVRDNLKEAGIKVVDSELSFVAKNPINIDDAETLGKIEKLMDALDGLDDVTNTYTNLE
jgi:YebC/PmpR family DNA-binding regulatory protein